MWPVPTEIPEKINATVDLRVKVTNKNFTKELNNISSHEHRDFTQKFKNQVRAKKA